MRIEHCSNIYMYICTLSLITKASLCLWMNSSGVLAHGGSATSLICSPVWTLTPRLNADKERGYLFHMIKKTILLTSTSYN